MDADQARRICRLIAGVVVVDDDLDDAENAFIDAMLARFGLATAERDALFPIIDAEEAARELAALAPDHQQQAFALLVDAVAADKRFVSEERAYLEKVGAVIGLSAADIDQRVRAKM